MIQPVTLYEFPFNERVRTYLRLERLFLRLDELLHRDDATDHHYALATVFEVMDVAARADLKSDVLKDLEKQKQGLNAFRGNPAIAEAVLEDVVAQIEIAYRTLNAQSGKAGQSLTDNEWLMSVRSRSGIPGGTCEFDIPAYHAWRHRSSDSRRANLLTWIDTLMPLSRCVRLMLRLLRDSGVTQKVMAVAGQYQQNLPPGRTFQLLRLRIATELDLVPEISGNRLLVSVRLMQQAADFKASLSTNEVAFELALCS